jgi:hypothetical protein
MSDLTFTAAARRAALYRARKTSPLQVVRAALERVEAVAAAFEGARPWADIPPVVTSA